MENNEIRIYSDESSHLGKTNNFMVIGAIWCNVREVRNFTDRINYSVKNMLFLDIGRLNGQKYQAQRKHIIKTLYAFF